MTPQYAIKQAVGHRIEGNPLGVGPSDILDFDDDTVTVGAQTWSVYDIIKSGGDLNPDFAEAVDQEAGAGQ